MHLKKILNKQVLKILILVLIVFFIATIALCVAIVSDIPKFVRQERPITRPLRHESNEHKIDSSVEVNRNELQSFYLWSNQRGEFKEWLQYNLDTKKMIFNKRKSRLTTKEEIFLGRVDDNDCEQIYCLQKKLPFYQVPSVLWKGLIGIEDYRFLDHKGVDPRGLLRALWHDIKVMRFEQGGSTLTQQLVKNLYFSNERKLSRKLKEMVVSVYLEWKYSKEDILAAYFNEVEWGAHQGIKLKGIYAASLAYFNKRPQSLSSYEMSILIGLLKGPYFYSPYKHSDRLRKRSLVVFNKLVELNLVSSHSKVWSEKSFSSWVENLKKRSSSSTVLSIWMMGKKVNKTYPFYVLLNQQNKIVKGLKKKYPKTDWSSKLGVWKKKNGSYQNIFRHYTKVERNEDLAFQKEKHQIGSLLKPIIYNFLIKKGLSLSDEVTTERVKLRLKSGEWMPRESHKINKDKTTHFEALITSMNNPIIRAVKSIGFDKVEGDLKEWIPGLLTPLSEYPAQILGSIELSMNDLALTYQKFFNDACLHDGGKSVLDALSDPKQTTVKFRVGQNLGQMKFFGKTGTTNKGINNWFVGHGGDELFISWVGVEDTSTIKEKLQAYGSNTSFLLFKNFYEHGGRLFSELTCDSR